MPLPAVEVSTEQCTPPTVSFEGSLVEDFESFEIIINCKQLNNEINIEL